MDMTRVLPGDCISKIFSFTTPKFACQSTLVSSVFKEAADANATWERFLPSDCKDIVAQSVSPRLNYLPAKQLYLHLCDHPLLVANGKMSFCLDKESGKKCFMLGAEELGITWGTTPKYWTWTTALDSRFSQVAKLNLVWWFEINGSIQTKHLSPQTAYLVFFIFKFGRENDGFHDTHVEFTVNYEGKKNGSHKSMILDPSENGVHQRKDGWMEVEMGDFLNRNEDDEKVNFKISETNGHVKRGLVVEGVEFRPNPLVRLSSMY